MLNFGRVLKNPPPSKLRPLSSSLPANWLQSSKKHFRKTWGIVSTVIPVSTFLIYVFCIYSIWKYTHAQLQLINPPFISVLGPSISEIKFSSWGQLWRPTPKLVCFITTPLRNVHGIFIGSHSSLPGNFHQQTAVPTSRRRSLVHGYSNCAPPVFDGDRKGDTQKKMPNHSIYSLTYCWWKEIRLTSWYVL